jgi:glycine oxidase
VKEVDLVIVGHGISGACLAIKAKERGLSVLVFDQPAKNTSSSVAVGLFHPMAFRRSLFSWMGIEVFRKSEAFYATHASEFFKALTLYRVIADTEEYNRWFERMGEPQFNEILDYKKQIEGIRAEYGIGEVKACAKLDVQAFLQEEKQSLKAQGSYREEVFPYHLVDISTNILSMESEPIHFSKVVFCEGLGALNNPWFSYLKFQPAKGDLLKVRLDQNIDQAVNKKHFIAPSSDGYHWLGATYNWKNTVLQPDAEAKEELLEVAKGFLDNELELLDHLVGIRPASYDRRPYVGAHPVHKDLAVLNGMGSKALILAPYCADILLNSFEHSAVIPKELGLERLEKFRKT